MPEEETPEVDLEEEEIKKKLQQGGW